MVKPIVLSDDVVKRAAMPAGFTRSGKSHRARYRKTAVSSKTIA
jgi:hypothetical protein